MNSTSSASTASSSFTALKALRANQAEVRLDIKTTNVLQRMSNFRNPNTTGRGVGVDRAIKQEIELVNFSGSGTRDWEPKHIKIMKSRRTFAEKKSALAKDGFEWHHINNVKNNPKNAANPNNVTPLTKQEHLDAHDGHFKNSTQGRELNRPSEVKKSSFKQVIGKHAMAFGVATASGMAMAGAFSVVFNPNGSLEEHVTNMAVGGAMAGGGYIFVAAGAHVMKNWFKTAMTSSKIAMKLGGVYGILAAGAGALFAGASTFCAIEEMVYSGAGLYLTSQACAIFSLAATSMFAIGIGIAVGMAINGLRTWMKEFDIDLSSLIESGINVMQDIGSAAIQGINDLGSALWGATQEVVACIWGGTKELASAAWEGAKTVASAAWEGTKEVASAAWEGAKSVASAAASAVQSVASSTWSGIKSIASSFFSLFD